MRTSELGPRQSVTVRPDQYDVLKREAQRRGWSLSRLMEVLIRRALAS
jgi:hypothetical protein